MLTYFKFDDEDTYYPPEYRIDDISKWLAEIMTETGITGTMCVMGDRVRLLKERGREDVLQAIAKHALVSHQPGNVHPELLEVLSDKEWEDGVQAMREYESRVTEDFLTAFGREPQGLSRHNNQWGAQHTALAGERELPYLGAFVGVPGTEQPCWYAGGLCLMNHTYDAAANQEVAVVPEHTIGEARYSSDSAFEKRFDELKQYVDDCIARGVELFDFFACHPNRMRARGFLEGRLLAGGRNRSIEEVGFLYGVTRDQDEEIAKKNFRKVCEYIRDHPALECKSISEIYKAFSMQPRDITRDEMALYAEDVVRKQEILLHQTFSPAELLIGMAESLVAAGDKGDLPNGADRRNILGPVDNPTVGLEISSISHAELLKVCREAIDHVMATGHLPGNIHIGENRLGVGQLAIAVAKVYAAQSRYDRYASLNLDNKKASYPEIAWNTDARIRRNMLNNPRYDPDLNSEKIAKHARLQTWSLKPAWLNPPRATYYHEGRIVVA